MGGPRASTLRQMANGVRCADCGRHLGGPDWARGPRRVCPACEPRPNLVLCNVLSRDWCVHFMDSDYQTRIGPWLLFDSQEDFEAKVLTWGHPSKRDLEQYQQDLGRTGFCTVHLHLADAERAGLIERGRGWPWTGYDLPQMRAAGKYPPERLLQSAPARTKPDGLGCGTWKGGSCGHGV